MSSRGFDYSKWDKLELSDDDSECPPFLEKNFYLRIRKEQLQKKKEEDMAKEVELTKKLEVLKKRVADHMKVTGSSNNGNSSSDDFKKCVEERDAAQKEFDKFMRERKIFSDEACKVVAEKTAVNSGPTEIDENLLKLKPASELEPEQGKRLQEEAESYSSFISKHEDILQEYMSTEFTSLEKREEFLMEHADVVFHEHAIGWMLIHCLHMEMEGSELAYRCVESEYYLQSIVDLAKSSHQSPRSVIGAFFAKIGNTINVRREFEQSLKDFYRKIQARAQIKMKELAEEAAEREEEQTELSREERLGPGGLDPGEVYAELPEVLQKAYDDKDVEALKTYLSSLPRKEGGEILNKMVGSGLWVVGGNAQ